MLGLGYCSKPDYLVAAPGVPDLDSVDLQSYLWRVDTVVPQAWAFLPPLVWPKAVLNP